MPSAIKTVTAEDEFTPGISATHGHPDNSLNVSVGGSGWVATVELQRKFPGDENWHLVDMYVAPEEGSVCDHEEGVLYRLGVPEGSFTSGSIPLRLSK